MARASLAVSALAIVWVARARAMLAAMELERGHPTLPLVSNVPWDAAYDSHSTTDSLLRAISFAVIVIVLVEAAKALARRQDEVWTYALLLTFQVTCALECIYQAAPDWASHGVSWLLGSGELISHSPRSGILPLGSTALAVAIVAREVMDIRRSRAASESLRLR